MRRVRIFQVDAFTRRPFAGNPAAVVLDADMLGDGEMQAIAREMNCSETAFLLRPDGPDHDLRIRYFTPTTEVPSCGHATIAAHVVRTRHGGGRLGRVWHRIGAGRLPVDISLRDGEPFVVMTQTPPRFEDPFDPEGRRRVQEALGLANGDLSPDLPVQWVDTGHAKVLVPLSSREALNRATPDTPRLMALHRQRPNAGVFLFTLADPDPGCLSHARMFAPNIGIPEDPVTGNGHGPLGAYLVRHGVIGLTDGEARFNGRQGEAMGRPGTVEVLIRSSSPDTMNVSVGGHAAIIFETVISLA